MKAKEMDQILDRNIDDQNVKEKKELIESLKKVKNLSLRRQVAIIALPCILLSSAVGTYYTAKDNQPFIPDTYVQDYYNSYYQDKDKLTLITDSLVLDGYVKVEDEYVIVKEPWKKEKDTYTRDVVYYNTPIDIDKEKASKIIESGYDNYSIYVNDEIKREKNITNDLSVVNNSLNGEMAVSYRELNKSVEEKRKDDCFSSTLITMVFGMCGLLVGKALSFNDYGRYNKSKKLLKRLGYEENTRKEKNK